MPSFFEQFRDFLAPRFVLERELGSGGMGTVYLARDTVLGRPVAIKALLPERASAAAAVRFLREARKLAELSHPNIVRIYDVGPEEGPFFYYIMEYLAGETLAERLTESLLSDAAAARLGDDLLAALGEAHRHDIIHRDIKPSNIFLVDGRAVLTDFGIAKSLTDPATAVTGIGEVVGTALYMPPEQMVGRVVPQTDLYALGMVLYESVTGELWTPTPDLDRAIWDKVPVPLRVALRRALAWSPEERWRDAAAFQGALSPARPRLRKAAVPLLVMALAAWGLWKITPMFFRPTIDLRVERFRFEGDRVPVDLGDSIARRVADRLSGYPDLSVVGPGEAGRPKVVTTATATVSGSSMSMMSVRVHLPGQAPLFLSAPVSEWRSAGDLIADSLLVRIFRGSPLDSVLPVGVLPRSTTGLRAFLVAEKYFARAWWDSAFAAYAAAAADDSTCTLCVWRHAEVGRFLQRPPDTAEAAVYRTRVGQFPPPYQTLIRAESVPLGARLDSLDALMRRSRDFLFGAFRLGDELLHRGPLLGQPRVRASVGFERATQIRADFAPAWEHLAWLRIADGNKDQAWAALRALDASGRPPSMVADLVRAAFAWRFLAPRDAARQTAAIIPAAAARHEPLDAGARYLNGFDAPNGAVWVGAQLDSANNHRESAMLAQVFGSILLGRNVEAHRVLARLHDQFADPAVDLFAQELDAVQLIFDGDPHVVETTWQSFAQQLREFSRQIPAALSPRATWMAALLDRRFGGLRPAPAANTPAPLVGLLTAYEAALRGQYAMALDRSVALTGLESASVGDPFLRPVLHLLRSEWLEHQGRPQDADAELRWHESSDAYLLPTGDPQPMEVDWAFGVLARWRRLRLAPPGELCSLYRDVDRLWGTGDARFAVRADSARRASRARSCAEAE